ncbi:MAG: hypothetical protein WC197_06905, partial [Candidatus Gastranaerophilaceae bacterium]
MPHEINLYNNKTLKTLQKLEPESIKQGGTAGEMIKSMDLPSTPDEFVKFTPYLGAGGLVSLGALKLTNWLNYAPNQGTVREAFQNSKMVAWGRTFDRFLNPITNRIENGWNIIKPTISKYTPNLLKNIFEKIKIGVRPQWAMAKANVDGLSSQAAEFLISNVEKLPAVELEKLGLKGLKDILRNVKAEQLTSKAAAEQIFKLIDNKKITDLTFKIPREFFGIPMGNDTINLAKIAGKIKGLSGQGANNPITKVLQKFTMSSSESIGGSMLGGTTGLIINSFFIGSAFKKATNAPKGEKVSTFMESFWGDIVGGFLVLFPASKILYKALGVKNIDKSASSVKRVERAIKRVNQYYDFHKNLVVGDIVETFKESAKTNGLTEELLNRYSESFKSLNILKKDLVGKTADQIGDLIKTKSAAKLNKMIDKVSKLKKFRGNLAKNSIEGLIKKSISVIGNFFSMGL